MMHIGRSLALVLAMAVGTPLATAAQEVQAADRAVAIGLFGFGVRGGVDFEGDGQAVAAVTVDAGHLFTPRLRLRPSGEIGFLSGDNTYVGNAEVLYRIVGDDQVAVPYVGAGLGVFGRDECGADDACPGLWLQFSLGFEVRLRDAISWTVEYHPMDAFRRHRVLIGLTTRRGS